MRTFRAVVAAACAVVLSLLGSAGAAEPEQNLAQLTVSEAAKLIKEGRITSEQLTRALLAKISANRDLNAFITLDEDAAIEAARAADDARRRDPAHFGPLHGVPLVVKDNIHVAGIRNTGGTPGLRNLVPRAKAPTAQAPPHPGAVAP